MGSTWPPDGMRCEYKSYGDYSESRDLWTFCLIELIDVSVEGIGCTALAGVISPF